MSPQHSHPRYNNEHTTRQPCLLLAYVVGVIALSLLRSALFFCHRSLFGSGALTELLRAIPAGLLIDSSVIATILAIAICFGLVLRSISRLLADKTMTIMLTLGTALAVVVNTVDIWYFRQFGSRMNVLVLDNLNQPGPIMKTVWADYPVIWVSLGLIAFAVFFYRLISAGGPRFERLWLTRRPILTRILLIFGFVFLSFLWTAQPFWRMSLFSDSSPALTQLRLNGVYTLIMAVERRLSSGGETSGAKNAALEVVDFGYLDTRLLQREQRFVPGVSPITRQFTDKPDHFRPLNIIIIMLESFSACHIGTLGSNHPGWTPVFDSLSQEGIFFTRCFAHETRTNHGLASVAASLPSILGLPIPRRVDTNPIAGPGTLLHRTDYQTGFYYGFDQHYDDMGQFMKKTGFETIVDVDSFDDSIPRYAWGVSDRALFDKVLGNHEVSTDDRPFLDFILTSTSHPPYDVPPDYKPDKKITQAGAGAIAFSFTDIALGEFLDSARKQPWFDSTIFVFVADHGQVPSANGWESKRFHIPLLFYGPALLGEPKRISTICGQVDIATTLFSLLNYNEPFHFFGRDLFNLPTDSGWAVMHADDMLYCRKGDYLLTRDVRDTTATLYGVDSLEYAITGTPVSDSSVESEMYRLTEEYERSAAYIFSRGLHRVR